MSAHARNDRPVSVGRGRARMALARFHANAEESWSHVATQAQELRQAEHQAEHWEMMHEEGT
jgi:hypothetical protein